MRRQTMPAGMFGGLKGYVFPALFAVLLAVSGCASSHWVTVRSTPRNPLSESLNLLAPGGPAPTDRTMQLLRRYDLAGHWMGDRQKLLASLLELHAQNPRSDTLYAIAELAYISARKSELIDEKQALDLYGTSVMHAYLYLFDQRFPLAHNPYDPRFRGACDLYNAALEGALRIAQKQGNLRPGHVCTLTTATRKIDVSMVLRSTSWHADDFDRFEFVSDYQVHGLRNHYHTYGLGVPLIAIRKHHPDRDRKEQFYPRSLSFPTTVLLHVMPRSGPGPTSIENTSKVVLELYDPLVSSTAQIDGRPVPLESDLSTPLAYFLNQPEFDDDRISTLGLLNPDAAEGLQGLYMLEAYQPGKIPVVMVHGLWSSPVTWMEMFNDLRSDPEIRDYYQFWFYLYPTGEPFWFSAAQMRRDLAHARQVLDPQHQQPALDQMVLVGHSMGGLVSKLQTVESGTEFWKIVTEQPFEQLHADEEVRNRLAATFFFEPSASIRRVVTIGTPHRGSRFSNDLTRWLGRKLISMPARMMQGRQAVLRQNPGYFRASTMFTISTSIDSLSPDSPFLPVLLTAQRAPWVAYHNIIGRRAKPSLLMRLAGEEEGDGVVSLTSAQLDTAESQIVVESDHSRLHRHPRSILEVRRILQEHLRKLRAFATPIQRLPPVTAQRSDRSAGGALVPLR
ncbi:MAG: esterase/lipase family protein [Pirellulales bacterium]